MLCSPEETLNTTFETLALNIKCKPSYSWVSIYQPYPRTELYEYSKKRGCFDDDIDSIGERYYRKSVINIKDIKKMERLHHLFSLGVAFPVLVFLIKLLIRLPLNSLYMLLWNFHRAWCYIFKTKFADLPDALSGLIRGVSI